MNNCTFLGRLTKDPQISSYTVKEDGKKVEKTRARFSLAVQRWGSKDDADFIPCVAFGRTADFVKDNLHKGKQIIVQGHLQSGSYENDEGETVWTLDLIVDQVYFTGKKEDDEAPRKGKSKSKPKKRRDDDVEEDDD